MAEVSRARHAPGPLVTGPLVDQSCHGVLTAELGLGTFETRLAAALQARRPAYGSFYDSLVGLALRRWCPPLLGLEPHCSPARYLARRRELGTYTAARMLFRGSGIGCFLAEGGAPDEECGTTTPGELAALVTGQVRETVRLETLAAQVADTSGSVRAFLANTAEALHTAARTAVAFTCAGAFHEAGPPVLPEVYRAAGRWFRERAVRGRTPGEGDAAAGCREPAVLRHLLWSALVTRRPVRLHCADPRPLTGFLRETAGLGARVVLLPAAPHHTAAARLAARFPHVYADIGPEPAGPLAEAPFAKLLFSTSAAALPELYVVRARGFTGALERLLTAWTEDGMCAPADAPLIADRVTRGNALRLYRPAGSGTSDS